MLCVHFDGTRADVIDVPEDHKPEAGSVLMTNAEYDEWLAKQPAAPPTDLDIISSVVPQPKPDITVDQLAGWVAQKLSIDIATLKAEATSGVAVEPIGIGVVKQP